MFQIVTDSTADLPKEYVREHGIDVVSLSYIMDGVTYGKELEMDTKEFYDRMRAGNMPTTSQVNPEEAREFLEKCLEKNTEILYLAFSSGLSGTYSSACIAAEELREEHPEANIIVIDTLSASLGEGLVVHKAVRLRDEGRSLEETAEWIRTHLKNFVHIFTVDDLFHLHRGGRVSKAAAVLGTLVSVKPKLHVDDEGHLILIDKVRGRKKALKALVDYMAEKMGTWEQENREDTIMISHGDALEDAEFVRALIREQFGIENCVIEYVGPTIGAHSGPGTIALFFMGESR
ncbi:MAG: DegV family protein [Acetatifactor sp.]